MSYSFTQCISTEQFHGLPEKSALNQFSFEISKYQLPEEVDGEYQSQCRREGAS